MWISLVAAAACAQGLEQQHPDVAASLVAAENGPGALWVNPANLAYDPDPRYGLFARTGFDRNAAQSVALTAGFQGLQVGVHNLILPVRADDGSESFLSQWSLDYGTSIPLPERLSVGILVSWKFVPDRSNFVAYDAGVSWRPLPWFGLAAVSQNVGSPDPAGFALPRTAAGFALVPAGPTWVVGAEYERLFPPDFRRGEAGLQDLDFVKAGTRLRPVEGLFLRASTRLRMNPDEATVRLDGIEAGLEVFFDGRGGSVASLMDSQRGLGVLTFLGTDEPGESLVRPSNRVSVLDLESPPPYEPRPSFLDLDPGPSWLDTLELLRQAENDRGVQALMLTVREVNLPWARWQEIHDRIAALRASGTWVQVYLDGAVGNGPLYVSTAANEVLLHPAGTLNLTGVAAQIQNLRGVMDLVGVEPQFVRRSEYKSAAESFTATEPSPATLEMTEAFVDDLYEQLVFAIASRMGRDAAEVRSLIDAGPFTPQEALDAGLVDGLMYPDQRVPDLEQRLQMDVRLTSLLDRPQANSPWEAPAQIAVVYIEGAIVDGESSAGGLLGAASTGADTVTRQLRLAGSDPRVKAVVLRVDSPGGSALASDRIWRAVSQVQDAGKPVVVSMGGLAASGGYYVSAGADAIWAEPATLTGSIGVYSGRFSTAELFDNMGLGVTTVQRGRNATLYSGSEPWDLEQRQRVESMVEDTYRQFKGVVSDGRGLTLDEVEEVARGRVWTGARAVDKGLVDAIGGLQDAIVDAQKRAGLREERKVGIVSYTPSGSLVQGLAPSLLGRALLGTLPEPPPRTDLEVLGAQLPLSDATWLMVTHPRTQVWMLAPWVEGLVQP